MDKRVSAEETRAWAEAHLRRRPELGLRNAIANVILEPRNPFSPGARRKPSEGFLLVAGFLAASLGVFVYFNFLH
jgi:hypothetical protein